MEKVYYKSTFDRRGCFNKETGKMKAYVLYIALNLSGLVEKN